MKVIRCLSHHCVKSAYNTVAIAYFIQCQVYCNKPANNQYRYLYHICIANYFHPPKRNNNCKNCQRNHYRMQIILVRQQSIDGGCPEKENRSKIDKYIKEKPE